jgi:hypothetical protein
MVRKTFLFLAMMVFVVVAFAAVSYAGVPVVVGDYVWYDANSNGLQDDGPDAGINGVQVIFFRDYECNGLIDNYDEIYDYDFTADDASGNPGYYLIQAYSSFCFVAFLNPQTIPALLVNTTPMQLAVGMSDVDQYWVDFGYGPNTETTPDYVCPKTIGFWKQQFTTKNSAKYSQAEVHAIVNLALKLTPVFSSYNDFPYYLNINGNAGPLARAKKQFAAFVLNLAAYEIHNNIGYDAGLSIDTPLDLDLTAAGTVGEAFYELEGYILSGTNLELANDLADAINNGDGVAVVCPN